MRHDWQGGSISVGAILNVMYKCAALYRQELTVSKPAQISYQHDKIDGQKNES